MSDDSTSTGGTGEATGASPEVTTPNTSVNTSENPNFSNLSEDDQIIEEVRAQARKDKESKTESTPSEKKDEPVVKDKDKGKPKSAPAAFKSPEEAVSQITAAFEKGDLETLAKLTGKPRSFFELNDAKWATFRQKEGELRQGIKTLGEQQKALENAKTEARKEYGAAIMAARAYQEGNLEKFVELVSELAGEDYDVAQRKVIEGVLAMDPETKKLRKLLGEQQKQIEELKNPKPKEPTVQDQQTAYNNAVKAVQETLSTHPVAKVRGYERMVLERVKDSYSEAENAYELSFEDAANQIIEERKAEAEAAGWIPKPAPAGKKPAEAQIPPRGRSADQRQPDGEPWLTNDLDDDEIIASLERDRKAGRLK